MNLLSHPIDVHELQRLIELLPNGLRSRVKIVPLTQPLKAKSALMITEKIAKNQFSIAIDLANWQQFSTDQQNLLFWHEAFQIINKTVKRFEWETAVIGAGLSISLMEIASQNLLSLSVSLAVAGLASYQLYQRKWGEQGLRGVTAADQGAIDLAMECGYSFSQAASSLQSALEILSKQAFRQSAWKKYQVRLSVLEMLIARKKEFSQRSIPVPTVYFQS